MRPLKDERMNMTKDELLRVVWLLDEYIDTYSWHKVDEDGFPFKNTYGYWCKTKSGNYRRFFYNEGFYYYNGSIPIYIKDDVVIAWFSLPELVF